MVILMRRAHAAILNSESFKSRIKILGKIPASGTTKDVQIIVQEGWIGFKRSNWSKYQSKVSIEVQNKYLNYLIDPIFQGVNMLFVLSFENNADRTTHMGYVLPKVETKDYNFEIDRIKFFWLPSKKWYENIWKH